MLATSSVQVGVRDVAAGRGRSVLIQGVRQAYQQALTESGMEESHVELILASGMITSNVGLVEVPHCAAPAGIGALAAAMVQRVLPEISSKPIWFVPGVRNAFAVNEPSQYRQIDFMRGEEVEALALLESERHVGAALVVLPGSHNKFIWINDQRQIAHCHTTMSGEMLSALTEHSILAASLERTYLEEVDAGWLLKGARHAAELGLCSAAFAVRGLRLFAGVNLQQCANFLAGAVFASDIQALKNKKMGGFSADMPIFLAGSAAIVQAMQVLIAEEPQLANRLRKVDQLSLKNLSGRGALLIARHRGLIN